MNKKIAMISLLSTLSILFGYIEILIPLPLPFPGAKIGISNIVILFCLYKFDIKWSWILMIIKVSVVSLLFSGMSVFIYSLTGGILSLFVMSILKKTNNFSIIFISIIGAVLHNIGQLILAVVILKYIKIEYYLPPLIAIGTLSGFIIGKITDSILKVLTFEIK